MAALAAAKQTPVIGDPKLQVFEVKTATTIYKGGLVAVDATGYAVPAADAAGAVVVGVATETVVNAGASGAKLVEVLYDCPFRLVASSIAITRVGLNAFVVDDQTVDETTTNSIIVGKVQRVISATEVIVHVNGLSA